MKKWTAGLVLVGLYRGCLLVAMMAQSEFSSIVGEAVAASAQPAFSIAAWIGFGFLARLYFRLIRWE